MFNQTIKQEVIVDHSPSEVYEMLINSDKHTEFTGARAEIDASIGGKFTAWDGYLEGENVELVPNTKIIQKWRSVMWVPKDHYSTVTFELTPLEGNEKRTVISFTHEHCPNDWKHGWNEHYWNKMNRLGRIELKIEEMGLTLPATPVAAVAVYKPCVVHGNTAYVSGQAPKDPISGEITKGTVPSTTSKEKAYFGAKNCGLNILAALKSQIGTLDRVDNVLKLTGWVCSEPDFIEQPSVINGCSELFRDIFGAEKGVGARAAVGAVALPLGFSVEIEGIFALKDE